MKKLLLSLMILASVVSFAQTSITCDSVLQTSTCAGGNIIIPFQTTGTFPFGNVFTAELSDNWGNWGNPSVLGTTLFVIGGNGIIFGTLPANANFGFLYRVRITSTNPVDTSGDSPNTVVITQIAQLNQIVSAPGDSACPGDTITLYALNLASSYLWSTGDTTQYITVTTSGVYSVTTTDFLTCESTATDTIVFDPSLCTGIAESESAIGMNLYPNPATHQVVLQINTQLSSDAYCIIRDVSGNEVMRKQLTNTDLSEEISLTEIAPGMYFVSVYSDRGTAVQKLIVE
jgi:hypothetical protein